MVTIEVVLCDTCKGKGYTLVEHCTDYHKGEYYNEKVRCIACKGSGRMEKTMTVELKPYAGV